MKFLIYMCLLVLFTTFSYANEKEITLKGVLLSRISQLITYRKGSEDFKICIYKDKDMYKSLKGLYKGKKYKELPIKVFNIGEKEEFCKCDILYSEKIDKNLLQKLKHKKLSHTLLVSNTIDKLYDGFIIALYLKENKIKIAINQEALQNSQLNINYRLLGAASKIINSMKEK